MEGIDRDICLVIDRLDSWTGRRKGDGDVTGNGILIDTLLTVQHEGSISRRIWGHTNDQEAERATREIDEIHLVHLETHAVMNLVVR